MSLADVRTYDCPRCLDTGFSSREVQQAYGVTYAAWFCTCARGEPSEAGYWFDRLYPTRPNGSRGKDDIARAKLEAYLEKHPDRRGYLTERIGGLMKAYNAERSRKLQEE